MPPNESLELLLPKKNVEAFVGAYYVCFLEPYFQIFQNDRLKRRFFMKFLPIAENAQNSKKHL